MFNDKIENRQGDSSEIDVIPSPVIGSGPKHGGSRSSVKDGGDRRCPGCMKRYSSSSDVCPHCNYVYDTPPEKAIYMTPGTMVAQRYIVGKAVGSGGFGVTYIGWDSKLDMRVAIKEYLPGEFATRALRNSCVSVFSGEKLSQFSHGLEQFVDEAKRLAKFQSEPGIVRVFNSFEENNTAYIIMEYLEGETLADRLRRDKTIPAPEAIKMMTPVMESLQRVHEAGIVHRDIAPDNIYLTKDGGVKVIDFGAARYATTSLSRSLTVIIKQGYSAEEQYRSRGDQGPHTDVYSLGATLYKMITGETPPDAMERRVSFESDHRDILKPMTKFTADMTKNTQTAILNALNVRIDDRTPDMISLLGELTSDEPIKRRNGKIKPMDVFRWPLWAKISFPAVLVAAITLCALLLTGVIGPGSAMKAGISVPEGKAKVPSIINNDLDVATDKLIKQELGILIGDKITDEKIESGKVLAQDVDAGSYADIGRKITVVVSAGAVCEYVPDVVGFDVDIARGDLEALGFTVKTTEKASDEIAPGCVISQDKKEGEHLAKGTQITLVVSSGEDGIDSSVEVEIPSLEGMTLEQATAALGQCKLYVSVADSQNSYTVPENQIISQLPAPKVKGHQGDTVNVVVSLGAEKTYVPDVTYKTNDSAISELENAGLVVSIKYEASSSVASGSVIRQSVAKNTQVSKGSIVTIVVSSGEQATTTTTIKSTAGVIVRSGITSKVPPTTTATTTETTTKATTQTTTKATTDTTTKAKSSTKSKSTKATTYVSPFIVVTTTATTTATILPGWEE